MNHNPKMFVSLSYAKKDKKIYDFFLGILDNYFSIEPADLASVRPPQEKIPELIRECDIFVAIVTKKYKIENKNMWKPSDWVQHEIGMAQALKKRCLIFQEKNVKLSGVAKSITTVGVFDRDSLEQQLGEFICSIMKVARKVREERIIKIDGWHDTKQNIEDIIEKAESCIYGIVEDFSSIDKFQNYLDDINKNVEVKLICSPFGNNVGKLERAIYKLNCRKKELLFVHPSKIGRLRMLFNEQFGLFVIHGGRNEYFGIRLSPIDDLKPHFDYLTNDSFKHKEPAKIEGNFYKVGPEDLANTLIWAINETSKRQKKSQFLYILASKFSLFVRNKDLQKEIINLAESGKCKIEFILSKNSLDSGKHKKSLNEILNEKLKKFDNVGIHILDKCYDPGLNRMFVTNELAMDVLDFGGENYYCSKITDKFHIQMIKDEIEYSYLNQEQKFCELTN